MARYQVFHYTTGHYHGPERGLWGGDVGIVVAKDKKEAAEMINRTLGSDDDIWTLERIALSKKHIIRNIDPRRRKR